MTKKISFGKVDGYNIGKKNCEVVLEIGFREFKGQEPYFTVCANLWNNLHTDIIRGGQCVDSLAAEYKKLSANPLYMEIVEIWKAYHLTKLSDIPTETVNHINAIIEQF